MGRPDSESEASATVVAGVDLLDPTLAVAVREAVGRVEDLLVEELSAGEDFLTEAALHLARAGGKRFRPLFTVLVAQLGPRPDNPEIVVAAAVVELVHLATLYHDDVMDEADLRRGAESANARWGNSMAILIGDYLFAHSSRLVSTLGPEAVRVIAETFAELVTGQMRETIGAGRRDPVEHYLRTVWEKTGSLISTAGYFGGLYSGAPEEDVERLRRFGDAVGTAFQIADDIIDIASDSDQTGKTPGTDLREGVHTLPVLYALQEDGPTGRRLRELLDGPVASEEHVVEALGLLRGSDGMRRARDTLGEYVERARLELEGLRPGPANAALRGLIDYTVERVG